MVERKTKIQQQKALSDDDFEWIKQAFPDLALNMLRNRFSCINMSAPRAWLTANCKGWYYMPGSTSTTVLFELEEDATLFKMAHEGKA